MSSFIYACFQNFMETLEDLEPFFAALAEAY